MNTSITYVGMDTQKKEHTVAVNYPGHEEIARFTVRNTPAEIRKLVKRVGKQAPGEVRFCYEAGVCGFTLKRRIEALGCSCSVIAPSLVPTKPGERVKTDHRDALKLLGLFKAGNKRVRRLLVQTAWNYRHPYKVSRALRQRRAGQPQWAIDIADRAGRRLRRRYWYLINHGKMSCKANVAIARELIGFLWSVFREYELRTGQTAF